MTYVDDLLIVGSGEVVRGAIKEIQKTWVTSAPEEIGKKSVKFLGCISQESYLRDLLSKEMGEELTKKRVPITRDQATIEIEDEEKKSAEDIRKAQKEVGELLWVVTRSRPDLMYPVSRMGSNITRHPRKVTEIASQVKGYLKGREEEGLCYQRRSVDEELLLECYSDSFFAPEGEESHGGFLILLDGMPIFWRSGRQALVTLSTAETELMEMIDGMSAGEAVYVLVKEVFKKVRRVLWSDSQSAISILTTEGGNWRTRRLKMRSSYARQAVMRGEWQVGHKPGEVMIADIGTKALASTRFEKLKELMNMKRIDLEATEDEEKKGRREATEDEEKKGRREATEDEEKKGRREATEDEEKKGRREATEDEEREERGEQGGAALNIEEVAMVVKLISLAAAISVAEGKKEKQDEKEEESTELYVFGIIYTILVATMVVLIPAIWKVGVRMWRSFSEGNRNLLWSRSHPGEPEEEPREVETAEGYQEATEDESEAATRRAPGEEVEDEPRGSQEETVRREETIPETPQVERRQLSIVEEWEEIQREEEAVQREVRQGLPHVMGTNDELEGSQQELYLTCPFRCTLQSLGRYTISTETANT